MYTKVSYEPRKCLRCNKEFTPNRKDKVYCRKKCGNRASERRQPDWLEKRNRRLPDKRKYVKYKKDRCSRCGFVPEHLCQLDVHHVDHNHANNDPKNLETVCANCHRLIHFAS